MPLVRTKIDMFRQTVRAINADDHERARVIATQSQSPGPKSARGYTASKRSSRHLLMKRSRSHCQTATWLYCEIVSQSSHVTARHSRSYCPTHFWYVLFYFPLLDWLFTGGRCETSLHNRTSRWTLASSTATRQPRTQASCVALQSRGTHSCACAWSLAEIRFFLMADQKWRMTEQN